MTPEHETRTLDGHGVTIQRGGAGKPLVFLHDVHGPLWEGLPERLARGRTVVLPALVGFPGSAYREDLDTVEDLAFWTLALVEQRGLVGCDVVGEGFGGWVAAEVVSRWPATFGRLALLAPFGLRVATAPPGGLFELRGDQRRRALFIDPNGEIAVRLSPDMPTSLEQFEFALTADRAAARFAWRPYLHNPKLARRLARVPNPTLVLWGEDDRLLPAGPYTRAWQAALPQATVNVLPETGHAIALERAGAAAEHIETFLGR
jgi:pimeloyl-ACP methyl ester carboxylesterase